MRGAINGLAILAVLCGVFLLGVGVGFTDIWPTVAGAALVGAGTLWLGLTAEVAGDEMREEEDWLWPNR